MNRELFVRNVEFYCARAGVKKTVACKQAGVSSSFITNINKGQTPSVDSVQQLAAYLGVTVSDLLGESPSAFSAREASLLRAYYAAPEPIRQAVDSLLAPYAAQPAEAASPPTTTA